MRVFLAVTPDEPARANLGRLLEGLKSALARWERSVRWVRPEHLHLTVRFLGETPPARLVALTRALGQQLPVAPFDVELDGAGVFAKRHVVRTLWLSTREGGEGLDRLHGEVAARLREAGWTEEARPFAAHLTIGRVRDGMSGRTAGLAEALSAYPVSPVRWRVGRLLVYSSDLSGPHPVHTVLQAVELAGRPDSGDGTAAR